MVGGEADDGVLQLPCGLQLPQEAFQGQVQLHLTGQICPRPLAHGERRHRVPVLVRHGVACKGIVHVAADRHVIGVEGRFPHILGDGELHHLQIRLRPGGPYVQAVAQALVDVAHVGVGDIPAVVVPGVVMIGVGLIAQAAELISKAEVHAVGAGLVHGPDPGLWDEGGVGYVLPVQGGNPPERVIEILKNKARVGQAVQGGRQRLVHGEAGEALGGHQNQVFPGEAAGIRVLVRGLHLGEVGVQLFQRLVGLRPGESGKVDVHRVFAVNREGGLRGGGGFGGRRRGAGDGRGDDRGRRPRLRLRPEKELPEVQPQSGQHAEAGDRQVGDEGLTVEVAVGEDPGGGGVHRQRTGQLNCSGAGGQPNEGPPPRPGLGSKGAAKKAQYRRRRQQQSEGQPRLPHARQNIPPELERLSGAAQGVDRQEGLEYGEIDRLDQEPEREKSREDHGAPAVSTLPPEAAEKVADQAQGQGKEQGKADAPVEGRAEGPAPDHKLLAENYRREPEQGQIGYGAAQARIRLL